MVKITKQDLDENNNYKEELKEIWKEIIDTANADDPSYSFALFEGTIKNQRKELIEEFEETIKNQRKKLIGEFEDYFYIIL